MNSYKSFKFYIINFKFENYINNEKKKDIFI